MTVTDNDDVLSKDQQPDCAVVAGVRVLVLHPVVHEPFAWQQYINTKGDDSDSGHFAHDNHGALACGPWTLCLMIFLDENDDVSDDDYYVKGDFVPL